ncbi:hypothetical protein TSAR_015619 [Trichomalopsis sarcophagae]|uniref:Uncharacterized protein n=1 Tax=Trichomalopsis sarcophagae TaxID=543379 RepID=A0A232EFU6_9HYME|nr:hypothetical protein TSAR_015619 [Trichomalopsis sarcophagae]
MGLLILELRFSVLIMWTSVILAVRNNLVFMQYLQTEKIKNNKKIIIYDGHIFSTAAMISSAFIIKWHGSATKANLRSRQSRGTSDTIHFYIGVWILHSTKKK